MGCELRTQADVTQIESHVSGGYQLRLAHGEALQADAVVLAVPAFAMANLIAAHDAASADQLRAVRYVSVATVTFAFPRDAVTKPFDGFGVVVPEREGSAVLACEVMSNKWPARSPQDLVVLRAFLGGHRNEGIVAQPNEVLIPQAQHALAGIFGLQGQPVWSRVCRWQPGNPQYPVGHLAALVQTEVRLQRTLPNVFLTGAGMRGLGLPDCVRQAKDTAAQVSAALLRMNRPVLEAQS
jgi:oxygen-dependent protoporphyrinogen oxidase